MSGQNTGTVSSGSHDRVKMNFRRTPVLEHSLIDSSFLSFPPASSCLQVGIHNGWDYIDEPETVFLTPDTAQPGHKRTMSGSMGKGHKRMASTGSSP